MDATAGADASNPAVGAGNGDDAQIHSTAAQELTDLTSAADPEVTVSSDLSNESTPASYSSVSPSDTTHATSTTSGDDSGADGEDKASEKTAPQDEPESQKTLGSLTHSPDQLCVPDDATAVPLESAAVESEAQPRKVASSRTESEDEDVLDVEEDLYRNMTGGRDIFNRRREKDPRLRNRQALSYFESLESRVKGLEEKLAEQAAQIAKKQNDAAGKTSGDVDGESEREALSTDDVKALAGGVESEPEEWDMKPSLMTLDSFMEPERYPPHPKPVIDVLLEEVPVTWQRRTKRHRTQKASSQQPESSDSVSQEVHRFRINSPFICDAFATVMGSDRVNAPRSGESHIAPFKAVLAFHDDLREYSLKLAERFPVNQAKETPVKTAPVPEAAQVGDEVDHADDVEDVVEDDDEQASIDTAKHLQAFLSFVDQYLSSELALYKTLRARARTEGPPKVWFKDLWKLYAPGDTVYNPKTGQALRVHSAWGGRKTLRKSSKDCDSPKPVPEEGALSKFNISMFSLDFDGRIFGPVVDLKSIDPYDGPRAVAKLPVYPIEYGLPEDSIPDAALIKTARSLSEVLYERGKQFAALAKSDGVAHMDYNGLSAGETLVN
ncbi:hypothetical protein LTR95_009328, partial [Oleoguttula sp. CCFEE 5521]